MWYDDNSPSCGNTQCQPLQPSRPAPPQPAVAVPYTSGTSSGGPLNPLNAVQGQVLQQDVQRPSSEVYGQGSVYGHVQLPSPAAPPPSHSSASSSPYPSHYSPREHLDSAEAYRPAPVVRTTSSQLSRPTQVVRYGQASSDNPDSYMHDNYKGPGTAPPAPVVGMVSYAGAQPGPPAVSYGQSAAPGAPMYAYPGGSSAGYSAAPSGLFSASPSAQPSGVYNYGGNCSAPSYGYSYGAPPPPGL